MWLGGDSPLGRMVLILALALAGGGSVGASPGDRPAAAADAVTVTPEQFLLYRFHAGFAPERLPEYYRSGPGAVDLATDHCGTPLVSEYLSLRDTLSPATRQVIDAYLEVTDLGDTLTSSAGHFRLTWLVDGDNAVPLDDVDPADGVPDFVARIAAWLETAWTVEVDGLRLVAPAATPVEVSFRRMRIYGYTTPVDPTAGTTRLVLNSTFSRFPPNDDPEGDVAGSAKVTAAHEFRHVSQYVSSRWSEGGWTEMDATWAEERVFDQVNDYRSYLAGDSPVRRPQLPLDAGATGSGSYDDAVFEIWLDRRFGDGLIRDYWNRRGLVHAESPLAAWDAVLAPRGASVAAEWGDFAAWNYAVGARAVPGVGYPEAADYPEGDLSGALLDYPGEVSGSVEHLAAAPVRLEGLEALGDRLLSLAFDGGDGSEPLSLTLHVQTVDGGGWQDRVNLDRRGDARIVLPVPASRLASVGVIIGNGNATGPARFWTLAVDTVPGLPSAPTARLLAVEPNPCNPVAWLTCEMSVCGEATLDIMDAAGRRVRRVWSGRLATGSHRFRWDGRDDAGRAAAAGVYVVRLVTPGGARGRKLTLVR